jgi:hypothetical protein
MPGLDTARVGRVALALERRMVLASRKLQRQRGDALFPNSPYILKPQPLDRLWMVADPLLHALAMQRDFVRFNLLGTYCFLVQKPRNRLRGVSAGSCDIDPRSACKPKTGVAHA